MSKLLTVIAAIGVLTTAFAGVATASETDWVMLITAGAAGTFTSPPSGSGVSQIAATKTGALDAKDANDGSPAFQNAPGNDIVKIGWYRPEWDAANPFARKDYKAPQAPGEEKTWADLMLWADTGYAGSEIVVNFFSPASQLAPNSSGGRTVRYKLVLTYAPAAYAGPTEWVLPEVPAGTTGNIFIGSITLPAVDGVKVASPLSGDGPLAASQVGGYRFNFVTPEPGSMLVLASGLTGLMGLIRRRSA
jgi:hypothetical protein